MRIGIISDTHGNLPTAVYRAFAGVDHIIHAGDIGGQSILDELETLAPLTAVYGNCDYPSDYPGVQATESITLGGTHFFIAHTPQMFHEALMGRVPIAPGSPLPHICIHGHTHIPKNEYAGAVLMLCPGSPVRPHGGSSPSVQLLTLTESAPPQATLHLLQ
jgi:putative phosphoesterase